MLMLENGKYVVNEAHEDMLPGDEVSYEERVISQIRQKYSLEEELAIQRQRDTKPDEFQAYFTYCEECKRRAKGL